MYYCSDINTIFYFIYSFYSKFSTFSELKKHIIFNSRTQQNSNSNPKTNLGIGHFFGRRSRRFDLLDSLDTGGMLGVQLEPRLWLASELRLGLRSPQGVLRDTRVRARVLGVHRQDVQGDEAEAVRERNNLLKKK
jgi:hypothetical protein